MNSTLNTSSITARTARALRWRKATATRAQQATARAKAHVGLARIAAEAWHVLVARALPILIVAVAGFALPVILGQVVQRLIAFHHMQRGAHLFALFNSAPAAWFVQVIVAIVGMAFARGVITHIALRNQGVRAACTVALKRYPTLLVGSVARVACCIAGAVALDLLLSLVQLDAQHVGQRAVSPDAIARIAVRQSLDALIVDGNVPTELIHELRLNAPFAKHYESPSVPGIYTSIRFLWMPRDAGFWPVVAAGVVCLFVAQVLLRFRTVMALEHTSANPVATLASCLRMGIRHLGTLTRHGLVVHTAFGLMAAVCTTSRP